MEALVSKVDCLYNLFDRKNVISFDLINNSLDCILPSLTALIPAKPCWGPSFEKFQLDLLLIFDYILTAVSHLPAIYLLDRILFPELILE